MSPLPGKPSNPPWIIADSDALIQLLLTDNIAILRKLQQEYRIQALLTEAVEAEVRALTVSKFPQLVARFQKALSSGVLAVMNSSYLAHHRGQAGVTLYAEANKLGSELYDIVDRGEAYSHAAAITLGVPILSHDIVAIRELVKQGRILSRPLLRAFDLLVFGLQVGYLDVSACDQARQSLVSSGEFIVNCFERCSFATGLQMFFARMLDEAKAEIGAKAPNHANDQRIWIRRQSQLPTAPPGR